jgi:D-3-phosphoglycerate dehydrogenase
MPPNIKRVFYVNNVAAPVFLDILATRPDIQVDRLENDTPDVEAESVLARAHIYQIGSSRQELAMRFQGYAPLLRRCPNLLVEAVMDLGVSNPHVLSYGNCSQTLPI